MDIITDTWTSVHNIITAASDLAPAPVMIGAAFIIAGTIAIAGHHFNR